MREPVLTPWKSEYVSTGEKGGLVVPPKIIYHYTKPHRVAPIIENKQLYFSPPETFNDPFDMHEALLDFPINKATASVYMDREFPRLSKQERKIKINMMLSQPGQAVERIRNTFKNLRRDSGVCCFSTTSQAGLLWSHYTDCHKGACLGFEIDPFPLGDLNKVMIQPVRYLEKIVPAVAYDKEGTGAGHMFFTKSHIWSYEQEIRAVSVFRNGLLDFDRRCLKEIYFGCYMSENQISLLINLLENQSYSGVECFKMVLDHDIFDIRPEKLCTIS